MRNRTHLRRALATGALALSGMLPLITAAQADYAVIWDEEIELAGAGLTDSCLGDMNGDGLLELAGQMGTQMVIRDALTGVAQWTSQAYIYPTRVSLVSRWATGHRSSCASTT